MTAAALVKKLNSKIVLLTATTIFLAPFILFAFWNVPSADDYMIADKRSEFSFWQLQSSVYYNWTGRYFATFISAAFSYSGFLYSHYYFPTLLLLLLTVLSWLFCLMQVNKNVLANLFSSKSLVLLSFLLLILEINIIPEPVTAFYWFSSAVTYQLPLIILIFLIGILIKLFFAPSNKTTYFILAGILIVMLNGCNELITLFVVTSATLFLGYYLSIRQKIPFLFISLYIVNIVSACLLLFSPGILNRSSKIGDGSFIAATTIAVGKFVVLNWFFLKEPLWWCLLLLAVLFLQQNKQLLQKVFNSTIKISPTALFIVYIVTGLLIYIPVLYVTNGSLPLRAENAMCSLYALSLIGVVSVVVAAKTNAGYLSSFYKYRYLLLSLLIFSTSNMKNITDSLLSGYFYKLVMTERLKLFEDAKLKNVHEVTFDDYEKAVTNKIEAYPFANRQVLKNAILKPPPIICFESDLYDLNFVKEIYGIKKLNIRRN